MAWTVQIGDANPLLVNASAKFDLRWQVHDDEYGRVQYVEYWVEVEGDVVAAPASAVADGLVSIYNQANQFAPRNVYLIQDGVTKVSLLTANCQGGPRITNFNTVEEDGNADSHWRYKFTVYAKSKGNYPNGALELQTSLTVITEQNMVVKKIWRVNCKALSMQAAMAVAMSYKPTTTGLHEEIERYFQENRVAATWVWELYRFLAVTEEPIQYMGAGNNFTWEELVGGPGEKPPPPVLHQAPNRITKIIVRGIVRGIDPTKLVAPTPHFQAGANMVRLSAEEETSFPSVEDPIRGTYKLPYMEVWLSTSPTVPAPNHGDHKTIQFVTPPGDGAVVAQ